jgi:hypothetical protein
MNNWAKRNQSGFAGSEYGISQSGKAAFNRQVMLERNNRQLHPKEKWANADEDIVRAADSYDSAARDSLSIAKGRDDQHSVLGMDKVDDNPHYTPYNWSAAKIANAIRTGVVERTEIIRALAESYRSTGMALGKDADAVAEAVIRRSELRDAEIDSSVHSLLQADGQEFLRDSLERSGMKQAEVEGIMTRLVGAAANRSKEGFAKSRNEIDMSTPITTKDGSEMLIVDLLSHDMAGDWQSYTRRVAGASALARQGITSRAARKEVISAIHAEQRALGEPLTPREEIESMFSNFDGGAVKGWSATVNPTAAPASAGLGMSVAKRMVQLAWLNQLGLTQLGETGAMIAQNGIATWIRRGPLGNLNAELKAGNKELLEDMGYVLGATGEEHHLFGDHLNLDELDGIDEANLLSKVSKLQSTGTYIQGFISLFNAVRSSQQKTAANGVVDKVFRVLKRGATESERKRMWSDLGIDDVTAGRLKELIDDGTIEFADAGYVNRVNMASWDGDLQDIVGASITRNINQVVQKSMAGEADAWMSTGWGSAMTNLKTFPMQATQKQFVRHFRHNDPEAYGSLVIGLATAAIASMVKAAVNGDINEMSAEDHAKRAFGYSNMTGFLPMAYDPIMTMMGLDDMRFNQYGKHSEVAIPILSFANDAMRLPGALAKSVTGTATYDDLKAKRTLPFANTMLIGEMLHTIGQAPKGTKSPVKPDELKELEEDNQPK